MTFRFLKAYMFSGRAGAHIRKMAWICLGSIFLGSSSLIVVLSIMGGFNKSIESRVLKTEPHLVVNTPPSLSDSEFIDLKGKLTSLLTLEDRVQEFEAQDFILRTDIGRNIGVEARGLSGDDLQLVLETYSPESEGVEGLSADSSHEQGVIIGGEVAFQLGIFPGEQVFLLQPESVLGSFGKGPELKKVLILEVLNTRPGDRDGMVLFYQKENLFGSSSRSFERGYEVFLNRPQDYMKVQKRLQTTGLEVLSWQDRNSSYYLALRLEKLAMTLMLGLALLITSFSIITLLILIVLQKQKDIGILLSMGLSRLRVCLLFGGMGCLLSVLGVCSGLGVGSLISIFLEVYPLKILPPVYQEASLPSDFSFVVVFKVFLFCLVVSIFSSLIPVLRLSKLKPVSALKAQSAF